MTLRATVTEYTVESRRASLLSIPLPSSTGREHVSTCAQAILPLVPVVIAIRSVAFSWTQDNFDGEFSAIMPLLCGTVSLGTMFFVGLLCIHGVTEWKELRNRKYLLNAMPSIFSACQLVLENFAMRQGLPASMLVLLQKLELIPGLFGERWITQKTPYMTQCITIAAIVVQVIAYMSTGEEGFFGGVPVSGFIMALGTALCGFADNFLLELVTVQNRASSANKAAEQMRCLFYNELFKGFFQFILALTFEFQFFRKGIFKGWDFAFVLSAVVPLPCLVFIVNMSVMNVGCLRTSIAATLDIGTAYVLEALIFGSRVELSPVCIIVVLTLLVLVYSRFLIDLRAEAALAFCQGKSGSLGSRVPSLLTPADRVLGSCVKSPLTPADGVLGSC